MSEQDISRSDSQQIRTGDTTNGADTQQKNLFIEVMAPGPPATKSQTDAQWDQILLAGLNGKDKAQQAPPPAVQPKELTPVSATPAAANQAKEQEFRQEMRSHTERTLRVLEGEEQMHKDFKKSESYLGRMFDLVYPQESQSLQRIQELRKRHQDAIDKDDFAMMNSLATETLNVIENDEKSIDWKRNINFYGSTGVRTGLLFLKGKYGILGTSIAFGLDQAKPDDPLSDQAIDAVLGMAKGGVNRWAFEQIGNSQYNVGIKAVTMSLTSRALDSTFTRQTWFDDKGHFDAGRGAQSMLSHTFNPRALAVDAAVLGVSQVALRGADGKLNELVEKSPLGRTVTTAVLYGFSSGGSNEALRQSMASEPWNISKIADAAAQKAATTGLSSLAAGLKNQAGGDTAKPATQLAFPNIQAPMISSLGIK